MKNHTLKIIKIQDFKIDLSIKKYKNTPIIPIFIPFLGCNYKCIFCDQEGQTGQKGLSIEHILQNTDNRLILLDKSIKNGVELGFFGGTFTAIPERELLLCLNFANKWRHIGIAAASRCSTRPDAINKDILNLLKENGFETIELGIQSWNENVLKHANRSYLPEQALKACNMIKEAGFKLVLQLMPGLPHSSEKIALEDCERSIELKPDAVRIYPCLVMANTPLASLWKKGKFKPWELEPTINFLTKACSLFYSHNIPVIRVGMAPEKDLSQSILAGPFHPALRNIVHGHIIFEQIEKGLANILKNNTIELSKISIKAPIHVQGDFWGYKGCLKDKYEKLGINKSNVSWWNKEYIVISNLYQ